MQRDGRQRDEDAGDVLDDVARMHPAVDRLRHLLAGAMLLDLKATAGGYWAHHPGERDRDGATPPEGGR